MKEYKFEIRKNGSVYEILDADDNQHFFREHPMVLTLGALVSFYQKLSEYCYEECIMGNSIYGNQRDMPQVYAVLRDNVCKNESRRVKFMFCKSDYNTDVYEVWMLIVDGETIKYHFQRKAINDLCHALYGSLKDLDEPKIKVWADYVLNKMTEDVELDYELFLKWLYYVHPETPCCYYEVSFDAYDNIDMHLTLRQNMDLAASYIKDHQHDYD